MPAIRPKGRRRVSDSGAPAGALLCGASFNNRGLRLRVLQGQSRGPTGPLAGKFVLLEAGRNPHAEALGALLGRETDAAEVLALLRRHCPGCVSVANASILRLEQPLV